MADKKAQGIFYTKNADYIIGNLLKFIPQEVTIIDPFCGEWDLLNLFNNEVKIGYDINPINDKTIKNDSLLNPISSDWIITNPPYLAQNKTKDKTYYLKYNTDDLYKAAIKSIMGCVGGILIVPLNFISSQDSKTRSEFLSEYRILHMNVFEESVFEDTTYTVCSFAFVRDGNTSQDVNFTFYPSMDNLILKLDKKDGYSIGNEIFNLKLSKIKINRLLTGQKSNSNLKLYAMDTGSKKGKIRLEFNTNHFYGKNTDRSFATLNFSKMFTEDQQHFIVEEFNRRINQYREKYHSLFLSTYRNSTKEMSRKRIGFDLAYRIISNIIFENNLDDTSELKLF